MANILEILNRDSRTTFSLAHKIKEIRSDYSEICEACDKIEQKRRRNYFIKSQKCIRSKFSTKLLNYLIVVISIYILTSAALIEANPIRLRRNSDQLSSLTKKFSCGNKSPAGSSSRMTETQIKERLGDIFRSCNIAISDSDELIKTYVKVEFNEDLDIHHDRWRDTENKEIMAWLYPENVMLKKKYNGNITDKHLGELNVEEWNKEKIYEHLEDIHDRLMRIRDGFVVIDGWMNRTPDVHNTTREIFNRASANIEDTICQIEEFFSQISSNAEKAAKDSIVPPLKVTDTKVSLEHWFVYREYEHVMKYAQQLLSIIQNRKFDE